jgi:hypothetical protein
MALAVIVLRRWRCDESSRVDQPRPVVRKMELKDSLVSLKIIGCNKATGYVHTVQGVQSEMNAG